MAARAAAGARQRGRGHRVRAVDRRRPGCSFISAGLSSIVSIVCAGLGIYYSHKGKQRVARGETPEARRAGPGGVRHAGSSRWSCRYLRPLVWVLIIVLVRHRRGVPPRLRERLRERDHDDPVPGGLPHVRSGSRARRAAGGGRSGASGACRREAAHAGRDGGARRDANALAAGPQRPGRSHPLPELRGPGPHVHLVLQRHHGVRRHEVRHPGDPRRPHAEHDRGRPPSAATRATSSPCSGARATGLDVHEEATDLCPYRSCRRTQTARRVPVQRPDQARPRLHRRAQALEAADALLRARAPAARAVDLPALHPPLRPHGARPDPGPQQQRAQRVRPHAGAPVLAAPPAAGRRGGHAAGRDGGPDEAHRACGTGRWWW